MASTSPKVNCDLNDEDNDTWSVNNCIFCNALLDGDSTILECLHIVCNNCIVLKKKTDSGIQCICQTVSKTKFTAYNIIPQCAKKIEKCSEHNCNTIPENKCINCKKLYCYPCSKEHLKNNKNHSTNLMITYPMDYEFALCPSCKTKCIEVYCDNCSIMICAFCHLKSHIKHGFKSLNNLATEFKTNLNDTIFKLKQIDSCLDVFLDQNQKYFENLELNQKSNNEKIDMDIDMLLEKVNERKLELQNSVEKCISDSVSTMKKNDDFLNELIDKNKYCGDLTDTMLKHNKKYEILTLSKIIENKLISTQNYDTVITEEMATFEVKMQLTCDETLNECFSSIKSVGTCKLNISSSPLILGLSKINSEQPSNNKENIQSENSNNITNFNEDSIVETQLFIECVCCKQNNDILIKCDYCDRRFHNDCHIPTLPKTEIQTKWKCTMCQDITKYSNEILSQHNLNTTDYIPIHETELKIIERILLELYCHNVSDNLSRDCLIKGIYPNYYEKIIALTSLNDVKKKLESKKYVSLFNFLKDLKQLFVNALLYYSPGDPKYVVAFNFQTTFYTMITKWLPTFDQTKLPGI